MALVGRKHASWFSAKNSFDRLTLPKQKKSKKTEKKFFNFPEKYFKLSTVV